MRDYHMHSRFCRHAVGGLAEYARSAHTRGIREICFTPHIPLPGFRSGLMNDRLRMDEGEFDLYLDELLKTRTAFPDMTILSGVEADYLPSMEGWMSRFLSSHSFDFVLMSIHYVSRWTEDEWVFGFDPRGPSLPSTPTTSARWGMGSPPGMFDCIAHFDLIKQPGGPVLATNRDDVEEALAQCAAQGMSVEINTSGMRKEIAETYPCDQIVQLMIEHEIAIVTGSDAHAPSQVGLGFNALAARHGDGLGLPPGELQGPQDDPRASPARLRAHGPRLIVRLPARTLPGWAFVWTCRA